MAGIRRVQAELALDAEGGRMARVRRGTPRSGDLLWVDMLGDRLHRTTTRRSGHDDRLSTNRSAWPCRARAAGSRWRSVTGSGSRIPTDDGAASSRSPSPMHPTDRSG